MSQEPESPPPPKPPPARVKLQPIGVSAEDPFAQDLLARQPVLERLTEYVLRVPTPYTMAVDAPWGAGKTKLLEMWAPMLEARGIAVVSFNAWQADYAADPLAPVIAKFRGVFPRRKTAITQKARKVLRGFGGAALPALLRAATVGTLDLKSGELGAALADAVQSAVERGIESFTEQSKEVGVLRQELERAATEEGGFQRRVIVLIDELDRCRPTFAVELLERIKHVLEVEGFVFVLALDRTQLAHSVRAVYGAEFDGEGYLGRFFDLTYRLPHGDRRKFAQQVLEKRLGWGMVVGERGELRERQEALEHFALLCDCLKLSPREIEQCAGRLAATVYTVPVKHYLEPATKVVLSVLAQSRPTLYRELVTTRAGAERVVAALELESRARDERRISFWLESWAAVLLSVSQELFNCESARLAEYRQRLATYEETVSKVDHQDRTSAPERTPEVEFAGSVLHQLDRRGFPRGLGVQRAVDALEFVRDFHFGEGVDANSRGEGT